MTSLAPQTSCLQEMKQVAQVFSTELIDIKTTLGASSAKKLLADVSDKRTTEFLTACLAMNPTLTDVLALLRHLRSVTVLPKIVGDDAFDKITKGLLHAYSGDEKKPNPPPLLPPPVAVQQVTEPVQQMDPRPQKRIGLGDFGGPKQEENKKQRLHNLERNIKMTVTERQKQLKTIRQNSLKARSDIFVEGVIIQLFDNKATTSQRMAIRYPFPDARQTINFRELDGKGFKELLEEVTAVTFVLENLRLQTAPHASFSKLAADCRRNAEDLTGSSKTQFEHQATIYDRASTKEESFRIEFSCGRSTLVATSIWPKSHLFFDSPTTALTQFSKDIGKGSRLNGVYLFARLRILEDSQASASNAAAADSAP